MYNTWGIFTISNIIKQLSLCNPDAEVRYDFGNFVPDGMHSYRGYYEFLAMGYKKYGENEIKVLGLTEWLKGAIGTTFHGWKGGEYIMQESTPVWVANSGESTGVGIVGVWGTDYLVVLDTRMVDR